MRKTSECLKGRNFRIQMENVARIEGSANNYEGLFPMEKYKSTIIHIPHSSMFIPLEI